MLKNSLEKELRGHANKEKAVILSSFFKTGKGEYGEGDKFLGITVPVERKVAQKYIDVNFSDIQTLLESPYHEIRMTALFILVYKMKRAMKISAANIDEQKRIVDFYLKNIRYINNWDLVDATARDILGAYYFDEDRSVIFKLARSNNLWEKRIAIIATFYFIAQNDFSDSLKLAKDYINDDRDLIQKATGWMLREIGKRNKKSLISFLKNHSKVMPRTMLRYSLEHFSKREKRLFM